MATHGSRQLLASRGPVNLHPENSSKYLVFGSWTHVHWTVYLVLGLQDLGYLAQFTRTHLSAKLCDPL